MCSGPLLAIRLPEAILLCGSCISGEYTVCCIAYHWFNGVYSSCVFIFETILY